MQAHRWTTVLTMLLSLPLAAASAQDEQQPPPGGAGTARPGKPVPRSEVRVSVPISDLEAEAAPAAVEALEALRHVVFHCAECDVRSPRPGACPRCEAELAEEEEQAEVVAQVKVSTDRSKLSITLHPHHWVGLGEIDELLQKVGARVDLQEFRLPTYARLSVTGLEESAFLRLRGVLVDLKVFPAVSVTPAPDGGSLWVQPKSEESGVTVAQVQEALSKMNGEVRVTDVHWAAYCPECGAEPAMRVTDPTCRKRPGGR